MEAPVREQLAGTRSQPNARNSWSWRQRLKRAEEMGRLGPVGGAAWAGRGSEGGLPLWPAGHSSMGSFQRRDSGVGRRAGRVEEGLDFAFGQGGTGHRATSSWSLCRELAQTALLERWNGVQQGQKGRAEPGLGFSCKGRGCLGPGAGPWGHSIESFFPFSEDSTAEPPPCLVYRGCPVSVSDLTA